MDQQLPAPFAGPWDPNEFRRALNRRPEHQTPIPRRGDRVLVRVVAFEPLADAEVLDVEPWDTYGDHYLWQVVKRPDGGAERDALGKYVMRPADDPWPWLLLATPWGRLTIREGRLLGSGGWWPLDWRHRWYPVAGGARLARPIDERMAA